MVGEGSSEGRSVVFCGPDCRPSGATAPFSAALGNSWLVAETLEICEGRGGCRPLRISRQKFGRQRQTYCVVFQPATQ